MALEAQNNPFPSILMVEGDPEDLPDANPSAGQRRLAVGDDHLLYLVDDTGTKTAVGGSSISDILDLPTAETDDTLVLAPDGAGGVEFRAEAGGGGGGAPLGVTRYASGSDTFYTGTGSQADVDATNVKVTFTAPASGSVVVYCGAMVQNGSGIAFWGLRESTTNLAGPEMVSNAGSPTWGSRMFYLTGVSAGSHTYKLAMQNGLIYHGPTYGKIEMIVWAA